MDKSISLALVGASGIVGSKIIQLLMKLINLNHGLVKKKLMSGKKNGRNYQAKKNLHNWNFCFTPMNGVMFAL